jgi:hypothetical protein
MMLSKVKALAYLENNICKRGCITKKSFKSKKKLLDKVEFKSNNLPERIS